MKTINPFMGLALCGIAAQAQEKPNFLIILHNASLVPTVIHKVAPFLSTK